MDHAPDARRYRILDVIGRGGFGTVYRGESLGAGGFVKEVAIKVLHPHVEADPRQLARFREEARLLGLLQHRAIVGVDSLTRLHERWVVVMEHVPGVTARDLLDHHGPLPLPMALRVAEEVAGALDAAYRATGPDGAPLRMLHRDVKPNNVQITRRGDVKLLDFGIARAEGGNREAPTGAMVYGSVPYLAPERFHLRDTHQADVFALALTLVQLLAGGLPRPGLSAPERIEEARRLLRAVPGDDDPAREQALERAEDLVARSLATEPEDRPDARTVERELHHLRHGLPVFDAADWAEVHVGSLMDARPAAPGDLTGMTFVEGLTPPSPLEGLGTASATFDDPSDPHLDPLGPPTAHPPPAPPPMALPPPPLPPPPPREPASTTLPPPLAPDRPVLDTPPAMVRAWPAPPDDSGSIGFEPPAPPEPVGPARPALRRPGGGRAGALAVVAASVFGLGGMAGGALIVAGVGLATATVTAVGVALFYSPGMCASFVGTFREDLRGRPYAPTLAPLLEEADRACDQREISAWQVNMLEVRMDDLTKDGDLSRSDLERLERQLDRARGR